MCHGIKKGLKIAAIEESSKCFPSNGSVMEEEVDNFPGLLFDSPLSFSSKYEVRVKREKELKRMGMQTHKVGLELSPIRVNQNR